VYVVNADGTLSEQTSYSPLPIAAPNPVSVLAVNTYQPGEGDIGGVFVYVGNKGSNGGDLNPFVLCTVSGNNGCTETDVNENLMTPLVQTCSQPPCNNVPPYSAGSDPAAMVVDPTSSFLYAVSNGVADQVYGFQINPTAGTLTVLPNSPQPSQGSQPTSIALHPSVNNTGQFLFVSNSNSQSIAGFTLSTTTGSMSNATTTVTPAAPSGIAVH